MTYNLTGFRGLNYDLCAYDGSRLLFRGPKANLNKPYVAFLGATETFGKPVEHPFPTLLSEHLPAVPVNLGIIGGGLDAYLNDPAVMALAKNADLRVVQIMGALNLTNHYFRVHPRRNDRFVCAHETLCRLFPEVDFTEFHFTKAMLSALQRCSKERYQMVCDELQNIWLARMTMLLEKLGKRTVLLWFAGTPPPKDAINSPRDPMLVDADMVHRMKMKSNAYVESVPDERCIKHDELELLEQLASGPAAKQLMGRKAHLLAAQALQEPCMHYLHQ
ncbi:DUF6473 family protein [Planktotalea sp.]|uniref:DUF6473 family protein n=1 Tax=Planktotalea sp. TaxID=2029877 RepID=UPI0032989C10